jgi:CDP-diacylglycerol--glycerol-3-phosphate 3-phosphatidyltransferase
MKPKTKERIKKSKEKTKAKIKDFKSGIRKEIKEDFFNVPNCITLARMVLVFFVVYMIFNHYAKLTVAIVFGIAAFTDWLDGFFARRLKQTTTLGARLDQVTDRIFTIVIVGGLLFYFMLYGRDQIMLLFLVCSREIIGSFGLVIRLIRNQDAYKVRYIGKVVTFVQSFTIAFIIVGFSWSIYPAVLTCILGIMAGIDYVKDSLS